MKPAPPLEASILRACIRWLRKHPEVHYLKIHGSRWSSAGEPDLILCVGGRFVAIELKRPGNTPTPLQEVRLKVWGQAGAITGVVTSVAELVAIVETVACGAVADWSTTVGLASPQGDRQGNATTAPQATVSKLPKGENVTW